MAVDGRSGGEVSERRGRLFSGCRKIAPLGSVHLFFGFLDHIGARSARYTSERAARRHVIGWSEGMFVTQPPSLPAVPYRTVPYRTVFS